MHVMLDGTHLQRTATNLPAGVAKVHWYGKATLQMKQLLPICILHDHNIDSSTYMTIIIQMTIVMSTCSLFRGIS